LKEVTWRTKISNNNFDIGFGEVAYKLGNIGSENLRRAFVSTVMSFP
jgi:hypothetical protein